LRRRSPDRYVWPMRSNVPAKFRIETEIVGSSDRSMSVILTAYDESDSLLGKRKLSLEGSVGEMKVVLNDVTQRFATELNGMAELEPSLHQIG